MLQAWHRVGALTYAGYILGFPGDTPASIERDIGIIQRELPIDLLEFFILTPLPGSADHKKLHLAGVEMEPDMNKYDVVHVTTRHATMSDTGAARDLPQGVGPLLLARARRDRDAPGESVGLRSAQHDDEAAVVPRRPAPRERAPAGRRHVPAQVSPRPRGRECRSRAGSRSMRATPGKFVSKHLRFAACTGNTGARSGASRATPDRLHGPRHDAGPGQRVRPVEMYTATPASKGAVDEAAPLQGDD